MKRLIFIASLLASMGTLIVGEVRANPADSVAHELFCFKPSESLDCKSKVDFAYLPVVSCLKEKGKSDFNLYSSDSLNYGGHPGERCLFVHYINAAKSSEDAFMLQQMLQQCNFEGMKKEIEANCPKEMPVAPFPSDGNLPKLPPPPAPVVDSPAPPSPNSPDKIEVGIDSLGGEEKVVATDSESSGVSGAAAVSPKGGCSMVPVVGHSFEEIFCWILLLSVPALASRKR